jgi:hypothetical protein
MCCVNMSVDHNILNTSDEKLIGSNSVKSVSVITSCFCTKCLGHYSGHEVFLDSKMLLRLFLDCVSHSRVM